jgi:hypothetical protein
MFGEDPNWFMSLVMPYVPLVVVAFAARDAWTRRRTQGVPAPIECGQRGRNPWIS